MFLLCGLGGLVVAVVEGLFYAVVMNSEFLAGLAIGSLGAAVVAALFWLVDSESGQHNKRFGSYGEERTAALFENGRMRRAGWQVVHNIAIRDLGDIDHVAIGPSGVLVLESKWANTPWRVKPGSVSAFGDDPTRQAWRAADRVKRILASKGVNVETVPVLVQWGPGGLPDDWTDRWIDDVFVVRRPRATAWLDQLGAAGYELDNETRTAAFEGLREQREKARLFEEARSV